MKPFHRSAAVYDVIYQGMFDYPANAGRLADILEAHTSPVESVLEVACGTGLYLEQLGLRYFVAGLDISSPMLEVAARRCPSASLHEGDMVDFHLGREFDAVVCMFSSIGYTVTEERMTAAIRAMAGHLRPGGVLVVEPWLGPGVAEDRYHDGRIFRGDGVTVARLSFSRVHGPTMVMEMHHLVATSDGVESFVETHEMGVFSVDQQLAAFEDAGLDVTHDPEGLIGRGLYVGVKR